MLGSLDGCESSVAGCHDAGNRVHINLFSDVPRLDDLLLVAHGQVSTIRGLPAVLLHPELDGVLLDQPQQLANHLVLDGLVGDADHVTHEPPDAVLKPSHGLHEVSLAVNLFPEHLELTHLQQVG